MFYLVHEAAWEYSGAKARRLAGADADLPDATAPLVGLGGYSINRALAETTTFRTFATTTDFATNYAVVRACICRKRPCSTAFGFFVGPFVDPGRRDGRDCSGAAGKRGSHGRAALTVPGV